ncbi:MAG: type 4a pilus biogenesis protein PilO [Candidatus Spechtbacterales bacterium]|nr:type 4a pilus biogenesis protein PilO [Candidatus Spechtbacterales bacterium]
MNTRSIIFFISVVMAVAFAWFFILPSLQSIDAAQKAVEIIKGDIEVLMAANNELQEASSFLGSISEEERELMELAVPGSSDRVNAAVLIESIAEDNGLSVDDIVVGIGQDSSSKGEMIGLVPVSMNATGSYFSIKAFIIRLEKSLRIFDVNAIKITPVEESDNLLTLEIAGSVYYVDAGTSNK